MTAITSGDGTVIRVSGDDPGGELSEAAAGVDATVAEVGSTGVAALEPLVTVTRAGRTAFFAGATAERVATVATGLERGDFPGGDPDAVVEHDPDATRLPGADLAGLAAGERTVLGACGWRRPANPEDHRAAGGFARPDPAAVLDLGRELRGRGWGDACHDEYTADTWERVSEATGDAALVVNAHGNAADALLLASAPFEVLDGASALARAVDADRVVVYASEADERAVETVREAAAAYPEPPAPLDVVAGPASYKAAEPTMALEAIEGNHRLEARLRPPEPAAVGLHGEPTPVHTARTLAHLAVSLREGVPRTRLVAVTGDVGSPATVEVSETDTLADALDGVDVAGGFKAACVGGRFGGLTADLDVAVDPERLAAAGLGTEGTVQVLGEDRCVLEFVGRRARFAAEENCGRCVPCREGTTQLAELLREIYDGSFAPARVEELAGVMARSSICSFGVDAGRPARTALAEFESELRAHADGRCPAGSCPDPMEAS